MNSEGRPGGWRMETISQLSLWLASLWTFFWRWVLESGGVSSRSNVVHKCTLRFFLNLQANISGGSMNPARSICAAIIQNNYERQWVSTSFYLMRFLCTWLVFDRGKVVFKFKCLASYYFYLMNKAWHLRTESVKQPHKFSAFSSASAKCPSQPFCLSFSDLFCWPSHRNSYCMLLLRNGCLPICLSASNKSLAHWSRLWPAMPIQMPLKWNNWNFCLTPIHLRI